MSEKKAIEFTGDTQADVQEQMNRWRAGHRATVRILKVDDPTQTGSRPLTGTGAPRPKQNWEQWFATITFEEIEG
jgi:hypothetical protein